MASNTTLKQIGVILPRTWTAWSPSVPFTIMPITYDMYPVKSPARSIFSAATESPGRRPVLLVYISAPSAIVAIFPRNRIVRWDPN